MLNDIQARNNAKAILKWLQTADEKDAVDWMVNMLKVDANTSGYESLEAEGSILSSAHCNHPLNGKDICFNCSPGSRDKRLEEGQRYHLEGDEKEQFLLAFVDAQDRAMGGPGLNFPK